MSEDLVLLERGRRTLVDQIATILFTNSYLIQTVSSWDGLDDWIKDELRIKAKHIIGLVTARGE